METAQLTPLDALEQKLARLHALSEALDDDRVKGMRLLAAANIASEEELSGMIGDLRREILALTNRLWVDRLPVDEGKS